MPEGAGGVEALLFALILGQLTFFIPYAFTAEQGVLLGAGMAYARRKLLRENRVEYELEDHFGISAAPADTIDLYQNRPL